ncbi:hypothetical protein [Exiguobacterium sp. AB2]|uniref:hypothetical protein n=1 Tax=Exiguobacterium sp. AB2 TaxID=1484479 RepID=UPI0004A98A6B|nr:hypothetical protein [Exiguobacterium sp. AB2]KDN57022.1 membrane protein [Exiguobacterium sp. AB2]
MKKITWLLIVGMALLASFVPLQPLALTLVVFMLFVLVSIALFQQLPQNEWFDRLSPLLVIGIGLVAFIAYLGLFLAWGNATIDSQVWQMIGQLLFMYVGVYVFVVTVSGFLAGATRQKPSRFFQPVLVVSVICYEAMLFLSLSSRT